MKQQLAARLTRVVTRFLVPILIVGGAIALLVANGREALQTLPRVRVSPVAVVETDASTGAGEGGIQAPGWIEPAPFATDIHALRAGIVESMLVLEGARVAKGETVAVLEHRAEEIAVMRAEAECAAAEAEIGAREAALRAAEELRDRATASTRVVRDAQRELDEARALLARLDAEIEEADASEAEARESHRRAVALAEAGAESEANAVRLGLRADALAARARAVRLDRPAREARLEAARQELEAAKVARSDLTEERRAVEMSDAALRTARAMLAIREADLAAARLALERSTVRAPADGVILRREARPGSHAGGNAPAIAVLYEPAMLQVRCDVPLKDAARLSVGLVADIRVDALPTRVFHGRVSRIVPQGDVQKNTVECKVAIDDPDEVLRPDMLARVRIRTTDAAASRAEGVVAPASALRSRTETEATVLLALPDGDAARAVGRTIVLGAEVRPGWIEVRSGLAAGDRLVLEPEVRDGDRFHPSESLPEQRP